MPTLLLCTLLVAAQTAAGGDAPSTVRLLDVTGDGLLDQFTVTEDGALGVAVNIGARRFVPVSQALPRVVVSDVLVSDLDGDGLPDLYLVSPSDNVALLGDGAGRFRDATTELGLVDGGLGKRAERVDVDGDGLDDVLLHDVGTDVLFWADGPGRFRRDGPKAANPTPEAALAETDAELLALLLAAVLGSGDGGEREGDDSAGVDGATDGLAPGAGQPPGGGAAPPSALAPPVPGGTLVPGAGLGGTSASGRPGSRGPAPPPAILPELQSLLDALYVNDDGNEVDSADIVDGSLTGADVSTSSGDVTFAGATVTATQGVFGSGSVASGSDSTVSGGLDNTASGTYSTVGGGRGNTAGQCCTTFVGYATVGGGLNNTAYGKATVGGGLSNVAFGKYSTVGGGASNSALGDRSTVGGGVGNTASSRSTVGGGVYSSAFGGDSVVGGGYLNRALGGRSTVSGGRRNTAAGYWSAVGGGQYNDASGPAATVPGGWSNEAYGAYSFAAGRRAKANHDGAFVWGDGVDGDKTSSAPDEFSVYASGGARIFSNSAATAGVLLAPGGNSWSAVSDRDAKEHVEPVDVRAVLEAVASLPIATWNYKTQDDAVRHMGPMAQDFHAAFGLGVSEKLIDTVDPDGVALAAIQGLDQRMGEVVAEKDAEIAELRSELEILKAQVAELLHR